MKAWPPEQNARLAELVAEYGPSWSIVAPKLGVTPDAARRRWQRLCEADKPGTRRALRPVESTDDRHFNPDRPDSSSIKFADHAKHLRLILQALIEQRAA